MDILTDTSDTKAYNIGQILKRVAILEGREPKKEAVKITKKYQKTVIFSDIQGNTIMLPITGDIYKKTAPVDAVDGSILITY